jgi:hypothetical protein
MVPYLVIRTDSRDGKIVQYPVIRTDSRDGKNGSVSCG